MGDDPNSNGIAQQILVKVIDLTEAVTDCSNKIAAHDAKIVELVGRLDKGAKLMHRTARRTAMLSKRLEANEAATADRRKRHSDQLAKLAAGVREASVPAIEARGEKIGRDNAWKLIAAILGLVIMLITIGKAAECSKPSTAAAARVDMRR